MSLRTSAFRASLMHHRYSISRDCYYPHFKDEHTELRGEDKDPGPELPDGGAGLRASFCTHVLLSGLKTEPDVGQKLTEAGMTLRLLILLLLSCSVRYCVPAPQFRRCWGIKPRSFGVLGQHTPP